MEVEPDIHIARFSPCGCYLVCAQDLPGIFLKGAFSAPVIIMHVSRCLLETGPKKESVMC